MGLTLPSESRMAFRAGAATRAYQFSLPGSRVIQLFKNAEGCHFVQVESAAAADWATQFAAPHILHARAELKEILFLIPDEHDDAC